MRTTAVRPCSLLLVALVGLGACAQRGGGGDGSELIGLNATAVHEALGDPQRIRREAGAQIWQYASPACVLDVFLYEEARGSSVVHVEARDLEGRLSDPGRCMGSLDRDLKTSARPDRDQVRSPSRANSLYLSNT